MKFFHIADTHLGAIPDAGFAWSEERRSEIWESFRSVVAKADREEVDLLLIAGDLFHRQPLMRELKEVNYLFSTLKKTKVVFIIGNHDYLKVHARRGNTAPPLPSAFSSRCFCPPAKSPSEYGCHSTFSLPPVLPAAAPSL